MGWLTTKKQLNGKLQHRFDWIDERIFRFFSGSLIIADPLTVPGAYI